MDKVLFALEKFARKEYFTNVKGTESAERTGIEPASPGQAADYKSVEFTNTQASPLIP